MLLLSLKEKVAYLVSGSGGCGNGSNSTSHLKRNPDLTQLPAFAQYIYIYNNIYLCNVIFILLIYCIFIQLFFAKVSVPVSYFQSI